MSIYAYVNAAAVAITTTITAEQPVTHGTEHIGMMHETKEIHFCIENVAYSAPCP